MNILIVSTSDVGGAGKACVRLHEGLLKKGANSNLLFLKKRGDYNRSYKFQQNSKLSLWTKVKQKSARILIELKLLKPKGKSKDELFIKQRLKGLELFSFPNSKYDITESELYQQADVINLHWVSGFLDYESFFSKNTKPVVWTLHDMNPFSGGEHYKEAFLGIDERGVLVRRILSEQEKDQFRNILALKKKSLAGVKKLHFVALSNWMEKEIKNNNFFSRFPIHKIPNGLDPDIFKIRSKKFSRDLLNLDQEKKVLLFVADLIKANRKGFDLMLQAIEKINNSNVLLFVIGHKNKDLDEFDNILQYGKINDDRLLSAAYSAADGFLMPSIMDNLPNTVLESLLCGTPVIGFPIGGIPDMVDHNKNGLLAKEISVEGLKDAIEIFLNDGVSFTKQEIRSQAVLKYDIKVQVNNYTDLFSTLVS